MNGRKNQEQVVKEAEGYINALGMTETFEAFFCKETVKSLIHEIYASYEGDVKEIVDKISDSGMPIVVVERARKISEIATGEEDKYVADVKLSMICSMHNLFQNMEAVVNIEDSIKKVFIAAFTEDNNEKVMNLLSEICYGVSSEMMKRVTQLICIPTALSGGIADVLMMISGGMPMISLEELESMLNNDSDDNCESGESEAEADTDTEADADAEDEDTTC